MSQASLSCGFSSDVPEPPGAYILSRLSLAGPLEADLMLGIAI